MDSYERDRSVVKGIKETIHDLNVLIARAAEQDIVVSITFLRSETLEKIERSLLQAQFRKILE